MSTAELATPHHPYSPTPFSSAQLLPTQRLFFWATLPILLCLVTMGVGLLASVSYACYVPWYFLLGGSLSLRWGQKGLWGSYGIGALLFLILREGFSGGTVWHLGFWLSIALDLCLIPLIRVELDTILHRERSENLQQTAALHEQARTLRRVEEEKQIIEETLQAEIQKWKEEAKQRLIERHQEEKRIALVQSEIELLTSQKADVMAEVREARALLAQEAVRTEALRLAHETISHLEARIASLMEERTSTRHTGTAPEPEPLQLTTSVLPLDVPVATPRITDSPLSASTEGNPRELNRIKGLYQQLREQFEEKRELLSRTRKELFQAEGRWLALEQEQKLAVNAREEGTLAWEHALQQAGEATSSLEEEVALLEGLLSSLFLPPVS